MSRAIFHIDNVYKIPNLRVIGNVCKTNRSTNTAFRGFGAPQAMMICETIIDHISRDLNIQREVLAEINFYKEKEKTFYGQTLEHNHIARIWKQVSIFNYFICIYFFSSSTQE